MKRSRKSFWEGSGLMAPRQDLGRDAVQGQGSLTVSRSTPATAPAKPSSA
jgi:hypothetical protein